MQSARDDNKLDAKGCLAEIRALIEHETSLYDQHFKPSLIQRGREYFDISKRPALNHNKEYKPYLKILDNKILSEIGKLQKLIEQAKEIHEQVQNRTGNKWKYGGYMHSAIANISIGKDSINTNSLIDARRYIESELIAAGIDLNKPDQNDRRGSAPGRIEGQSNKAKQPSRRGSAPGVLSTKTHSTLYSRPQHKQQNENCFDVLRDIFLLASKLDIPEKIKNEYIQCNYEGILKNSMADNEKQQALFDAAKPALHGRVKGELHQTVLDIDIDNPLYLHDLKQLRHRYKQAVEKQEQQVHDNRNNSNP